jgi:hypothetical protein
VRPIPVRRHASDNAPNDMRGDFAKRSQHYWMRIPVALAGVEFIDENGGGPGVRLRKPPQGKQRK